MKRIASLALAAFVSTVVAVPAASASTAAPAETKNIVGVAADNPQFSTLVRLVKRAGLQDALSGNDKLTVFAPTNAAFAKLPRGTLRKVQRDKRLLTSILTYHVVGGAVPASEVVKLNRKSVETLNGQRVRVRVSGAGRVSVNNARVTATDVPASNGVIHVINRVLIPRG